MLGRNEYHTIFDSQSSLIRIQGCASAASIFNLFVGSTVSIAEIRCFASSEMWSHSSSGNSCRQAPFSPGSQGLKLCKMQTHYRSSEDQVQEIRWVLCVKGHRPGKEDVHHNPRGPDLPQRHRTSAGNLCGAWHDHECRRSSRQLQLTSTEGPYGCFCSISGAM